MLRPAIRFNALCFLLMGLILRAFAPLGYMPASPGSGLLFELCPGQLPAGFTMPGKTPGHDLHHHGAEDKSQPEQDHCPIGHLLSSAVAVDDGLGDENARFQAADLTIPPSAIKPQTPFSAFRSRGPPV
jgi:hypothetical protein